MTSEHFRAPAVALAIVLAATLLTPRERAFALTIDSFTLPLPDLRLEIGSPASSEKDSGRSVTVVAGGAVLSTAQEWEAVAIGAETFSLRHREWRGVRLDVDCATGSVSQTMGDLGAAASPGRPMEGAACRRDAPGNKRVVTIPAASLSCRPAEKRLKIGANSRYDALVLSGAAGWEVEEAGVSRYRLRRREWPDGEFWAVDAARRTAIAPGGRRLDREEGGAIPAGPGLKVLFVRKGARSGFIARKDPSVRKGPAQISPAIQEVFIRAEEAAVPVLRSDADAPGGRTLPPASRWREKEKQVFGRLLAGEPCDVLVIPFQVEGSAVDRIERALMTRYLSEAIARGTGSRLPNPTLVARALGDGARAIPDAEIYQLANDLRARTLITGFVGHDREERLRVKILVRERRGSARFGEGGEPAAHTWTDLAFSDERLPAEVFLDVLGEALARIFPDGVKSPEPATAAADAGPVPTTLADVVAGNGAVHDAFMLQLLGLLVPDEGTVAETFFARSLVSLRGVSSAAPDYRLLKAGAYASLNRRPAALAALGTPVSDEERALESYLNGDLPALREQVKKITRPVPRLLARIRLNDLEHAYGGERAAIAGGIDALVEEHPGLGVLRDRLELHDPWAQPSALLIKQEFETNFPLAGQSLEDLAAKARATGEEPSEEDLDQAVFNHYHQALTAGLYAPAGSTSPVPGDALDLLFAAGQRTAVKRAGRLIQVQGLPEAGLEVLARLERLYPDHLDVLRLKGSALQSASRKAGGAAGDQLQQEATEVAQKLLFWSDGQTPAAAVAAKFAGSGRFALPSYDADYPRRPYWKLTTLGDRRNLAGFTAMPAVAALPAITRHEVKNALISLAYTVSDLRILKDLYEKLVDAGLSGEAHAVLAANRKRFQGHALWPDLLAQADAGDGAARKVYEKAMAADPLHWDPYYELGRIMIGDGDFAGASRMFLSYPLFQEPARANRVDLSHAAYAAAMELLFHGAAEEAVPLLEFCAGLGTGSGSEMGALAYLAQVRGDFTEAARLFMDRGNRYRHRISYGLAIRFLHIMGRHDEAEALFASLQPGPEENALWNDAVIGLRAAGKTDAAVVAWFRGSALGGGFLAVNDGQPLFMAFLVDRGPNDRLSEILATREDMADLYAVWFAQGYRLLQERHYEDAYRTFLTRVVDPTDENFPSYRYVLPALAWAGVKSGNAKEVGELLERYQIRLGKDFHYHLAAALLHGGQGEAEAAAAELRKSSYVMDTQYPPIDFSYPWYQLLEATEWLQADAPRPAYLDLIVRWSKICQRLYPTEAWTYAVEAVHTTSPADRTRALALGLFLDRHSQRLSGFSPAEQQAAAAWLSSNNPFRAKGGQRRHPDNTF